MYNTKTNHNCILQIYPNKHASVRMPEIYGLLFSYCILAKCLIIATVCQIIDQDVGEYYLLPKKSYIL